MNPWTLWRRGIASTVGALAERRFLNAYRQLLAFNLEAPRSQTSHALCSVHPSQAWTTIVPSTMAKLSLGGFLHDQRTPVPPVVHADIKGQTIVVTGANAGLGFEAAKHFALQKPGRLILACRSEEKGTAAVARKPPMLFYLPFRLTDVRLLGIKEETSLENVEMWPLDLAKFSSVTSFADRFEKDGGRLDVLVANAAVSPSTCRRTPDGWEES